MRTVAEIALGISPLFLAGVIPFFQVIRGRRAGGPFLLCWALLVFWFAFYSLGVPLIIGEFNRELARRVSHWMPEGSVVMFMMFFGWFYAELTVLIAKGVCRLRERRARNQNS
jgi:hypothetical protein